MYEGIDHNEEWKSEYVYRHTESARIHNANTQHRILEISNIQYRMWDTQYRVWKPDIGYIRYWISDIGFGGPIYDISDIGYPIWHPIPGMRPDIGYQLGYTDSIDSTHVIGIPWRWNTNVRCMQYIKHECSGNTQCSSRLDTHTSPHIGGGWPVEAQSSPANGSPAHWTIRSPSLYLQWSDGLEIRCWRRVQITQTLIVQLN